MITRTIANQPLNAIGLGCMGMSFAYAGQDDVESLRTLARSIELGVNHWDTADMYGAGKNEELVALGLKGNRDKIFLASKFANVYDKTMTTHQDLVEAGQQWIVDATPEYIAKCIDRSLARLQVDHIDLYYMHRVDPRTPIEETVGAMAKLVEQGKVRHLGLSEVAPETLKRAIKVHPIAAVQSEFSLWSKEFLDDVIPLCAELGIAFVPYSPLGRGFLTGEIKSHADIPEGDYRKMHPRFSPDNFDRNLFLVDAVAQIAAKNASTPAQVAIAWVLGKGNHLLPIPGTKKVKYLEQNVASAELVLSAEDIATLDALSEPNGDRYQPSGMQFIRG